MVAAAVPRARYYAVTLIIVLAGRLGASAFQHVVASSQTRRCSVAVVRVASPRVGDGEDVVLFADDDGSSNDDDGGWGSPPNKKRSNMSRWDSLNPKIKARIVKEAHERAIRNKKRREPAADKKRRLYTQYREMERQSKRDKFVTRPTPTNSKERKRLSEFTAGETHPGKVISITNFGAYVDIGTEVDGLLHVSQITRDEFVDHPRNFLSPGDDVDVRIVRLDPQLKKLQLTMLPDEVLEEENVLNKHNVIEEEDDRIQLDEIEVDDELWGEIRRVTDYGAYVELGSVVRGFLHFMDHPMFGDVKGAHPREYMRVGDRVRVWVLDVDAAQSRIKLTANRPMGLPGPRREIQWI